MERESSLKEEFDQLYEVPWSRSLFSWKNYTRASRYLRRIVRENQYDVVHVHTPIAAFLTRFALRNARSRTKVVYTAHGFHFGYSGKSPYYSPFFYLEKLAARWTDALIVINEQDLLTARKYELIGKPRLFHTPGIGIDLDRYDRNKISESEIGRVRAELGIKTREFLLLMVAEFNPGKRHRDLLKAFERLGRADIHIAFAGEGLEFEQIQEAARELKFSSHLHFLGFRQDVPLLIAASDATILPSEREGLPRSIMESMALETPVLGSRIRGISELLSDDCGILFEPGNIEQIATSIEALASDPMRCQKIAKNARVKVEKYSLENVLKLHEEIYNQILNRSAEPAPNLQRMKSGPEHISKSIVIYGAGGHGRVLLDIAEANGVAVDCFVDDGMGPSKIEESPVICRSDLRARPRLRFIVGIGDNAIRSQLFAELSGLGEAVNLVHPFSSISRKAKLGVGIAIMPGVVVNIGASIGDNVILNTSSSIDHDCVIGAHCHICPGVHLAGTVSVGAGTFIGTGSSVVPGIRIGKNCVIGAGSLIIRDIPDNSKAFGVPARIIGRIPETTPASHVQKTF